MIPYACDRTHRAGWTAFLRIVVALMVIAAPLAGGAAEEAAVPGDDAAMAREMATSVETLLAGQREELANLKLEMQQLVKQRSEVLEAINTYDAQDMDHRRLLLETRPAVGRLEEAIRKNQAAGRMLADTLDPFKKTYGDAATVIERSDSGIELARHQLNTIRESRLPEATKQRLTRDVRRILATLEEQQQLGRRYRDISQTLIQRMTDSLAAKGDLREALTERLKRIQKASLLERTEPYRNLDAASLRETLVVLTARVNSLWRPASWQQADDVSGPGRWARWIVFLVALVAALVLAHGGRRRLRQIEAVTRQPDWHYRNMGTRLLHRALFLLTMTLLFGAYSFFELSRLGIGLSDVLFRCFTVLLLTRWGIDFLDYGLNAASGPRCAFIAGSLPRFFRFFRAGALLIIALGVLIGENHLVCWLARDAFILVILTGFTHWLHRLKRLPVGGASAGDAARADRWITTAQWANAVINGGAVLLSVAGYGNLARHWSVAWIETAVLVFAGWVSWGAIGEWQADHRRQRTAAAAAPSAEIRDDVRGAMIRAAQLLWLAAMITGVILAWDHSGELVALLGQAIDVKLTVGSLSLRIQGVVLAVLVLFLTHLTVRIGRTLLVAKILDKQRLDSGLKDSIATITAYLAWALGLVLALGILGVDTTSLAVVFGALSIGIGFGLQNIFNNFISGLILLFERPIQVGDYIEVDGLWATVKKINVRATQVQTFDNASVIIPNADLISQRVTNWSYKDLRMRRNIEVGVAYGSDIDAVTRILLDIAMNTRNVLKHPKPDVLFVDHADSALIFRLRIWVHVDDYWEVPSGIRYDIDRRFREAGIEIAFPQRDLHIRSLPEPSGAAGQAPDGDDTKER